MNDDSLEDGKARLQAERKAREQKIADEERRRKRSIGLFAGAGTLAVVVVVALILLGGGDDEKAPPTPKGLLTGIEQEGTVLGDPDAPVTVVEFVDLQCPFCRDYSLEALPGVIKRYVRTGKVKLDLRVLSFLGDDSVEAGLVASGAARQDRLWQFVEEFYRDQGKENSGYVDDAFLRKVGEASTGLDLKQALAEAKTPAATTFLDRAEADRKRYGVESTPSFVALRDGQKPKMLQIDELTADGFASEIDPLLE